MQMYCTQCGNAIRPNAKFCSTCGAPVIQAQPQRLQPGQILNGVYRIQHPLSKGGMGAIYLVEDQNAFDRQRVVKEMLDYFDTNDPQQVANAQRRFEDEARTLAQLRHPGIPDIHAHFTANGRHYIVMEYVAGDDLESLLGKKPSAEQIVSYGIQICDILEYLGNQKPPVVHHDIKPANIVIDRASNTARLVDFGTAKARLAVQPGGKVGVQKSSIYGTEGYAPPEQYNGQSEPRSDVYALAATLYHLLTDDDPGDHPFQFSQLATLPSALRTALERALESQPAKRSNAAQFQQALESALRSLARQSKQLLKPSSPALGSHESYAIITEQDVPDALRPALVRHLTNKLNLAATDAEVLTWNTPAIYAKGLNDGQAAQFEKELKALGLQARRLTTSQQLSWRINASSTEMQRLVSQGDLPVTAKRYPVDNRCHCYHCGHEWTTQAASEATLPSACGRCSSAWYEHRIFRCTLCGHEFAHANMTGNALALFPHCPACKSAGWHLRNRLTLQKTSYVVDVGQVLAGQSFQTSIALALSSSTVPLRGRVTTATAWLQIPQPALTRNQFVLTGSSTGLVSKRSHVGSATVISNAGAAKIEIAMQVVDPPRLVVPNPQLDFGTVEGTAKISRPLLIQNGGDQLLEGRIENIPAWLQLSTESFKGNHTEITCTIQGERMPGAGPQIATLSVISNGGQTSITVSAIALPTILVVQPTTLDFGLQPAKKRVYRELSIGNPGLGELEAEISSRTPWLSVDKQKFKTNQIRVRVSIDTRKLQVGQIYNGSLTITSNGGTSVIPVEIQPVPPVGILPALNRNPWVMRLIVLMLVIPFFWLGQIVWSTMVPDGTTSTPAIVEGVTSPTPIRVALDDPARSTPISAPPTETATMTATATAAAAPTASATPSPTSTLAPTAEVLTATSLPTDAPDAPADPMTTVIEEATPFSPLATPPQPGVMDTQPLTTTPTLSSTEIPTPIPTETPTEIPSSTPTVTPTATPAPPTPTATLPAAICADPRSVISSPANGQLLSGQVAVTGTAVHNQFNFYKLELAIGLNAQSGYSYLAGREQPVRAGTLALFQTTTLPNGVYTLRLTVVEQNGNYPPPCQVTVQIRN